MKGKKWNSKIMGLYALFQWKILRQHALSMEQSKISFSDGNRPPNTGRMFESRKLQETRGAPGHLRWFRVSFMLLSILNLNS